MSYTGRTKYKSRREKLQRFKKNYNATLIIGIIFLAFVIFMKRVDIIDYIRTYFY